MSSYERAEGVEPVRIVTMRRLRKLQRLGQSGVDELGESVFDDLFEDLTRQPPSREPPRER